MSDRTTLAVDGTCHAVLKLLAAARTTTLSDLVEELLRDGLRRDFERDLELAYVVRQLVSRDERIDPRMQRRALAYLDTLMPREGA